MIEERIVWLKNKLFFDFFESTKDDGMMLSLIDNRKSHAGIQYVPQWDLRYVHKLIRFRLQVRKGSFMTHKIGTE